MDIDSSRYVKLQNDVVLSSISIDQISCDRFIVDMIHLQVVVDALLLENAPLSPILVE